MSKQNTMFSNNAGIYVEFHRQASQFFFSLENDFRAASEKVNREEEEFRFQQLKKDYVNELKHQLEMSAQELMKRKGLTRATGKEISVYIKDYLHRFVQKINAY